MTRNEDYGAGSYSQPGTRDSGHLGNTVLGVAQITPEARRVMIDLVVSSKDARAQNQNVSLDDKPIARRVERPSHTGEIPEADAINAGADQRRILLRQTRYRINRGPAEEDDPRYVPDDVYEGSL